jgi:hypothetical protein
MGSQAAFDRIGVGDIFVAESVSVVAAGGALFLGSDGEGRRCGAEREQDRKTNRDAHPSFSPYHHQVPVYPSFSNNARRGLSHPQPSGRSRSGLILLKFPTIFVFIAIEVNAPPDNG